MLPKKNRADTKTVEKIFKNGSFINSASLTFKFILTQTTALPRISFVAPKSVTKLAVKRNLLRRNGYTVLEKYINKFPTGLLGIFLFKKYQNNALVLENEIKNILNKIN